MRHAARTHFSKIPGQHDRKGSLGLVFDANSIPVWSTARPHQVTLALLNLGRTARSCLISWNPFPPESLRLLGRSVLPHRNGVTTSSEVGSLGNALRTKTLRPQTFFDRRPYQHVSWAVREKLRHPSCQRSRQSVSSLTSSRCWASKVWLVERQVFRRAQFLRG